MIDFNSRAIWLPVKNTTEETIPGCALMEVVANPPDDNGQDEEGNWLVRKPTIDGNMRVIVNGEVEIPPGETGMGHREMMAVLLYDTTEDLPLLDDQYGSKAGSWQAHKDKAGFRIDHAGNGRVNAQRESGGGGAAVEYGVRLVTTAALVTGPLPYYPATADTTTDGTSWTTGPACRALNIGTGSLPVGYEAPGLFVGTEPGGEKLYVFKGGRIKVLTDVAVSIACSAGSLTPTTTKTFKYLDTNEVA